MDFIEEWLEAVSDVVIDPEEFFSEESRRDAFGFPIQFAAVTLLLTGLINAVRTAVFSTVLSTLISGTASFSVLNAGKIFLKSSLGAIVTFMIWAGIVHIFVKIFGGSEGYSETLSVFFYATALAPITALLGFIPVIGWLINFILFFYSIYIQVKGLESFQSMTTGNALGALLLPIVILIAITVIIFLLVLGVGMAAVLGSGGIAALGA